MLHLILHDCFLFVETLNLLFSWSNLVLELLDLVVKYEFEFFKLHRSFVEIINLDFLVCNGCLALLQFAHLTLDLKLFDISLSNLFIEHLLKLLLGFVLVCLLMLFDSEFVLDKSQVTLFFHTAINLSSQFLFVFVFDHLDIFPSIVFKLIPFLTLGGNHLFDLLRKFGLLAF